MKKILILLLSAISFTSFAGTLSHNNIVSGSGVVYRVLDGDTYDINIDDQDVYNKLKATATTSKELSYFKDKYKNFRVRLGNIDTAESTHYDSSRNTLAGKNTSTYVKELLSKEKVNFYCWDYGRYGRAICSVTFSGGDVGIHLIKNGHSEYVTSFGINPFFHEEYKKASKRK